MVRNTLRNKKRDYVGKITKQEAGSLVFPLLFFFNLHQRVPERCGGFNKGVRSDFFLLKGGLKSGGQAEQPTRARRSHYFWQGLHSNLFQSIPWYPGSIAIRKVFANIRKVFTIGTIRGHLFAQNCPIVKKTVQMNCPTFINLTFITP